MKDVNFYLLTLLQILQETSWLSIQRQKYLLLDECQMIKFLFIYFFLHLMGVLGYQLVPLMGVLGYFVLHSAPVVDLSGRSQSG